MPSNNTCVETLYFCEEEEEEGRHGVVERLRWPSVRSLPHKRASLRLHSLRGAYVRSSASVQAHAGSHEGTYKHGHRRRSSRWAFMQDSSHVRAAGLGGDVRWARGSLRGGTHGACCTLREAASGKINGKFLIPC